MDRLAGFQLVGVGMGSGMPGRLQEQKWKSSGSVGMAFGMSKRCRQWKGDGDVG